MWSEPEKWSKPAGKSGPRQERKPYARSEPRRVEKTAAHERSRGYILPALFVIDSDK